MYFRRDNYPMLKIIESFRNGENPPVVCALHSEDWSEKIVHVMEEFKELVKYTSIYYLSREICKKIMRDEIDFSFANEKVFREIDLSTNGYIVLPEQVLGAVGIQYELIKTGIDVYKFKVWGINQVFSAVCLYAEVDTWTYNDQKPGNSDGKIPP